MTAPEPVGLTDGEREALWSKPCPFCPIVVGDAPADIVEEGERHVAFVPLGPHVPGHVLFVPRDHVPDATVNLGVTAAVFAEAARYVRDLNVAANIVTSVGTAATQSVPHLHVHVVPRGPLDGLDLRWPWRAAERAAHDPDEVVALRESVALLRRWQVDAQAALAAVKDRMDEHAYDELATVLHDGVSDHLGEPYAPVERAAHEAQVQAGDRLREAVEALAEVYASRVQMLSQPRFKSTADGRERNVWGMAHADLAGALAAAAPTPPQDAATEGGR